MTLGAQNGVIWMIQSIFSTDIFHLFLLSHLLCRKYSPHIRLK